MSACSEGTIVNLVDRQVFAAGSESHGEISHRVIEVCPQIAAHHHS